MYADKPGVQYTSHLPYYIGTASARNDGGFKHRGHKIDWTGRGTERSASGIGQRWAQLERWPVSETKSVTGIENFVRGAHKRVEYEMPNNCMTDVREVLVY